MKPFTLFVLLLLLGVVGSKAQVIKPKIERFPSIQLKKPELKNNYLAPNPAAFLKSLQQQDNQSLAAKDNAQVEVPLKKSIATQMPIIKPDSTIKFQILAARPDSTTLYPMPVKKLE